MSCNEYIIWISGHIDGTNPIKEEKMLRDHLAGCAHCRQVLEEMKANDAALQEVPTPPDRIHRNVMSAVRKDAAGKKRRIRNCLISVAAVAAVVCLVFAASLRLPEGSVGEIIPEVSDTPTEAAFPRSADDVPAYDGDPEPLATEEAVTTSAEDSSRNGKTRNPQTNSPCHCVFVALPSGEDMPADLPPMDTDTMMSRIPREAYDHYYYGGSIIYGATEMTAEELQEWEDLIDFRFLQEFEETDTYIVVFCSESR